MTASPDDRTAQVDETETATNKTSAKRAPARKQSSGAATPEETTTGGPAVKKTAPRTAAKPATAKKTAAARKPTAKQASGASRAASGTATAAKAAAEKAAPATDVVVEPLNRALAENSGAKTSASSAAPRSAAAARTAAAKNSAARSTAPKSASTARSTAKPAAKSTAAKTTAAKTTAAKTTPAKTTASSAAAKTAAAKSAAAKAAATKAAAAKSAARSTTAKTTAAKAAAAKAAATKAAKAAAAKEAKAKAAAAEPVEPEAVAVEAGPASVETAPETPLIESTSQIETQSGTEIEPAVESATVVEPADAAESEPAAEAEPDSAAPVLVEPPSEVETAPEVELEVVEVIEAVVDSDDAASGTIRPDDGASAGEAIRIRGLVKHFGDNRAVDGIDLTVPAGSFYGVVGPNGAGKTTTLSIVAGLLRADAGSVVICGIDQASDPQAAKRVMGVLPDRLRTFDRLTGRQLLYYYGLLRGLTADVIEKRAADLARAFDLGDALSRVVSDYSAGMTKKIMLAGAMIHSPRVLVLDEPFESVDPVSSAVILDILRAYVSHGGTVILSSHGMDLVERVCSRVAIIVGGEVLAEGTIDEVRAGQTLEARFVELAGSSGEVEGLEWLHTFSD
ncbi:ABC transporter ATP-binding protein [Microbacterium algeriense]|uniref:ABC transporter ATP-binding protein n=1 Tax=Microbacterium algeriense TaxID=2615184 RepID=UPI0029C0F892|nr:ABC transporter ATP-binding protein [Microbacterium algeriense]